MATYKFHALVGGDWTIQKGNGNTIEGSSNSQAAAGVENGKVVVTTFYPYYKAAIDLTSNTIEIDNVDVTANGATAIVEQLNQEVFVGSSGDIPVEVTVYQLKTVLTDAQIKALPTTFIDIVPTPAAGKIIVFMSAFIKANIDTSYTNIGGNSVFVIAWGNWDAEASGELDAPNFLNEGNYFGSFIPRAAGILEVPSSLKGASFGSISDLQDKPLKLILSNSGDLTAGNASNTLEVTVFYSIVDL